MSTQSPLPQNDPLLIAFQQLKHTPEYRNAVNWTIKAENENHADGELWFAFAAGWNAREALAATPADPVREAATALEEAREILAGWLMIGVEYDESLKVYEIIDNALAATPADPVREAATGSQLASTQAALKMLHNAVLRSRSVNDPLGVDAAMTEAGKWF